MRIISSGSTEGRPVLLYRSALHTPGRIDPQRFTRYVIQQTERARLHYILRGKNLGFSLEEIREWLELYDADITQHAQLRVLLDAVQKRRDQLLLQRQAIDEALAELAAITAQTEAALTIPAVRAAASTPRTPRAAND